ncbi:uncharacterized protein isoform X2 [Danio rerio]|uniref:Uncharacterized protein isoform X2 n=1 Tax=Danio rerio TaxID=7955 RepID=A0AB32TQN3_DANRE
MASALQCFYFILMLSIPIRECMMISQDVKCIIKKPCFDLSLLPKMVEHVSKDMKTLHSCVLLKVIDLFQDVLIRTEAKSSVHQTENINHHHELINIMFQLKNCLSKKKNQCNKLYNNADTQNNTSTAVPTMKDMTPYQLAVIQLQKLKNAHDKVSTVHVQERVMDELKTLHSYMQGKGFRKILTEESHDVS